MIGFNLRNNIFSNNFDITDNKEISDGLYNVACYDGFPGFNIVMTSAIFHNLGTYFNLNAAFIMIVSFTIAFLVSFFKMLPVIKSNSDAFLILRLVFILLAISAVVVNFMSMFS